MKPKISVLTATTRPDGLVMVAECLSRQTERDFEWLICSPKGTQAPSDLVARLRELVPNLRFLQDPPRRDGDFYRLNGAWNKMVADAKADLLVFAVDWIWFDADALERFWATYLEIPKAIVSSWADHYRMVIDGQPEVLWESDPRVALVEGDGKMPPEWNELSLCAMPRRELIEVGGFDEDFDQVAGYSEKEVALRMSKECGCPAYLALGVEHRIFTHSKADSQEAWDAKAAKALEKFDQCASEIRKGQRTRIPWRY